MVKQPKLTRKEIKQPDEFITFSNKAFRWLKDNPRLITATTSGIILILAAVVGTFQYLQHRERTVLDEYHLLEQELSKTTKDLSGHELDVKAAEFAPRYQQLGENYSRTATGQTALLRAGNLHARAGQFEPAVKVFELALPKFDSDDPRYHLILESLAYCYEGLQQFEGTLPYLERITTGTSPYLKDRAYFHLGRIYRLLKREAEAIANFKKVRELFPASPLVSAVDEEITLIGK
ncbi:MAG: hypothetical protein A2284_18665 [Deltaproteobacteria bacterium RIFOXYA12_FULL_61_11]|nr:MAG: hypothetical protein A2284_18665 [Deltaproteobacteria bacterium RIFOXYA12_FULL_61_11]